MNTEIGQPKTLNFILILFLAYTAYVYAGEVIVLNSLTGISAIDWVNKLSMPSNFINDFPTVSNLYDRSFVMWLYWYAFKIFGVSAEMMVPTTVVIEVFIIAAALCFLTRTIFPNCGRVVLIIVCALAICSCIRAIDIARFRQPVFWGLYYNFCDFFRLLAIAAFIKRRYVATAVLLALSFATHPPLALMTMIFLGGMALPIRREFLSPKLLGPILGLSVACIGWYLFAYGSGSGVESVGSTEWFKAARFSSYHWFAHEYWFPASFTANRYFIGFFAYAFVLYYYLGQLDLGELKGQLVSGFSVVLLMSVAGVLFSALETSVALVQLSLHRSTDLFALVGLPIVAYGLWQDVTSGRFVRILAATPILLVSFFGIYGRYHGIPLVYSLIFLALSFKNEPGNRRLCVAAVATTLILVGCYLGFDNKKALFDYPFVGLKCPVWFGTAGVSVILIYLLQLKPKTRELLPLVAGVLIVVLGGYHLERSKASEDRKERATEYLDLQRWANKNTATDSLFMVSPALAYGWRDYSARSSFGNVHEWLFAGWHYNSSAEIYREGLARTKEFGLDPKDYHHLQPPLRGSKELKKEIRKRYYQANDQFYRLLARKYGIDYFVMEKRYLEKYKKESSSLEIAYQNSLFLMLEAA